MDHLVDNAVDIKQFRSILLNIYFFLNDKNETN